MRAHDPNRLAVHVEPDEAAEGVVPLHDPRVTLHELAVERQHHRDGVLGDGVELGCRSGTLVTATPRRSARVEIDPVEPRASHGDEPNAEVGEGVDRLGVGAIVDEEARRVASRGERRGLRGESDV